MKLLRKIREAGAGSWSVVDAALMLGEYKQGNVVMRVR